MPIPIPNPHHPLQTRSRTIPTLGDDARPEHGGREQPPPPPQRSASDDADSRIRSSSPHDWSVSCRYAPTSPPPFSPFPLWGLLFFFTISLVPARASRDGADAGAEEGGSGRGRGGGGGEKKGEKRKMRMSMMVI